LEHLNSLYLDNDLNETISLLYQGIYNSDVVIDQVKLRRAIWVSSILSCSEDSSHKNVAQVLAGLLYIKYKDNFKIGVISYVLYSRCGNLIATKHLENIYDNDEKFKTWFGDNIDFEVVDKIIENKVSLKEKDTLFTDFQKELWQTLISSKHISISAPTSAGKSFIVQNFIVKQINENNKLKVLYIVPTKALLNQVADDFREIDSSLNIRISYLKDNEEFTNEDVNIYLLTPERCIKLLNQNLFVPDLIFIDEIQNTEDINGRGVVFEYVANEIADKWANAKIVTAGPFIKNSNNLFKDLFYKNSNETVTITNPTFQLKTKVEFNINLGRIEIMLWDDINNKFYNEKRLVIPEDKICQKLNKLSSSIGSKVSSFTYALGKGEQNLIYCAKKDNTEKFALELVNLINEDFEPDQDVKDLIEYLRNEIHEKYNLIECLSKGIAFHHSILPDVARKEIEVLFKSKEKSIIFLFCTSTLMQGVNLPAKNLFIHSPRKQSQPLSKFEFGNLKGRAGRINESLYGTIYGLKLNKDEDNNDIPQDWHEEYYSSEPSKEIITANTVNIENNSFLIDSIKNLSENNILTIENKAIYRTVIYLRGKFLKSRENLREYLGRKITDTNAINQIENLLELSLKEVKVSYSIIKQNPQIDPILLDILYNEVNQSIASWNFIENERFYMRYNLEIAKKLSYEEKSYYWQFSDLCYRLQKIFNITSEIYISYRKNTTITELSNRAFQWMEGNTLNRMIKDNIKYLCDEERKEDRLDKNSNEDINKIIKSTIEYNNNAISFVLAKYFKALSDILEEILPEEEKLNYHRVLSMHTYLELGSYNPNVILLISNGISRSLAIMIDEQFKLMNGENDGIPNITDWLKLKGPKMTLRRVFMKYLDKQGYFKL
jgi:hypothetical protein